MSERRQYTDDQLDEIAQAVWGEGRFQRGTYRYRVPCPACGSDIQVHVDQTIRRPPPRFRAICSAYGRRGAGYRRRRITSWRRHLPALRHPRTEALALRQERAVMSRTAFTESELRRINEEVWSHPPAGGQECTDATCPACGADARVLVSWSGTGAHCGAEVLKVNCDGCGRAGGVKPAESRCPDFDSEQMQAIVELHQRGRTPVCPTCATPLRVIEAHTLGTLHYSSYCHRGGGMGQLAIAR